MQSGVTSGGSALGLDRMLDAILGKAAPAAVGAACHQYRILEAASGDQASARTLPGQDRVVDDSRTVHEQRCLRQQVA